MPRDILTVGRLTRAVRTLLEGHYGAVWIQGEISNLARPSSGHLYFSLKDADAQVRCAMFRVRNAVLNFTPGNGAQVVLYARVSMYEPRGEFQLIVEHMEAAGEGALRLKFEALKRKLAAEGLFDLEHKRTAPAYPACIGIISSPTGAAVRDILQVLRRRNPALHIVLYPSAVQGAAAAPELVNMIRAANRRAECDVLIVARGGGSLEDLWAFNEEVVVRAIFESDLPVIAGVGHETDLTLTDLVADLRAPTPSAAAELAAPDAQALLVRITQFERRATHAVAVRLAHFRLRQQAALQRLVHPGRRIETLSQRLDELSRRLAQVVQHQLHLLNSRVGHAYALLNATNPAQRVTLLGARVTRATERLHHAIGKQQDRLQTRLALTMQTLNAVSPLATLDRGYAIVTDENGRIARDAAKVQTGDPVTARLASGALRCRVEEVDLGSPPLDIDVQDAR